MEDHVKTCIKAVKAYIKPLHGRDYQRLERNLTTVAREIDKKGRTLSEIQSVFSIYEEYLWGNFQEKFKKVKRDGTYQNSREHLTTLPLPGSTKDESGSVAQTVNQGEPDRQQNTRGQQPKSYVKKNALDKTNEKRDGEESRNSTPQSQESGNGARGKQEEEDVTLSNDSSDADEWRQKLTEREDELDYLKNQLMNLAKECGIDEETPQTIITEAIKSLKDQEKKQTPQNQTKGKMKGIEDELEELKKSIFNVKKVKASEHDTAKTKAKIQDLHRQEEELIKLKQTVIKPKKGKDEVHSLEDTMKRVSELQSLEEEFLKLKRAAFKPNKGKEEVHSTEDTVKRVSELQSQEEELEKLKQFVFTPNKGKDVVHSAEDTVKRVSELQRARAELQRLLEAIIDSENPFTTDTAMEKVQQLKKSASEKEKKYNSLMRDKEDMARRMDIAINRLQRERDDLLKRFSKVAGAKMADGNPNQ